MTQRRNLKGIEEEINEMSTAEALEYLGAIKLEGTIKVDKLIDKFEKR
jgi:hypothetical protein